MLALNKIVLEGKEGVRNEWEIKEERVRGKKEREKRETGRERKGENPANQIYEKAKNSRGKGSQRSSQKTNLTITPLMQCPRRDQNH